MLNKFAEKVGKLFIEESTQYSAETSLQDRFIKYKCAIERDQLNLDEIRKLAFAGIPDNAQLRLDYWGLLLSCLGCDHSTWPTQRKANFDQYLRYRKDFFSPHIESGIVENDSTFLTQERINEAKTNSDNSSSDDPLGVPSYDWESLTEDAILLEQIQKDIVRTRPGMKFFNNTEGNEHYQCLTRMLFIYGKLNPGISYVQGMNEIIAVLFYVCKLGEETGENDKAESNCFFYFTSLMSDIMDNFIVSSDQSTFGISYILSQIEQMINVNDPIVSKAMTMKEINLQFFCFRWVTLLFTQEFEMPDIMLLWDSIFAQIERTKFICGVACALLLNVRDRILNGSFAEVIELLQHYPNCDMRAIINKAIALKNTFVHPNNAQRNTDTLWKTQPNTRESPHMETISSFVQAEPRQGNPQPAPENAFPSAHFAQPIRTKPRRVIRPVETEMMATSSFNSNPSNEDDEK